MDNSASRQVVGGTTNFTSRIAIAGLSIASLSAVAIPFAGLMLAVSDICCQG